jgi:hypothetical protein
MSRTEQAGKGSGSVRALCRWEGERARELAVWGIRSSCGFVEVEVAAGVGAAAGRSHSSLLAGLTG